MLKEASHDHWFHNIILNRKMFTVRIGSRKLALVKQLTFVIKAVYPVNTGTFVISSQQEKVFWVFNFVCKE